MIRGDRVAAMRDERQADAVEQRAEVAVGEEQRRP